MMETKLADARSGEDSFLTDDFLRQLMSVGEADIIVGLPTLDNAKTISPILDAIQTGLVRFFPRDRAAIINADAGSHDGTRELAMAAAIDDVRRNSKVSALRTLHSISTQYAPSEGSALRSFLAAAELLRPRACAVISPDATHITPDWIATLLQPVYRESCDLVLPTYRRHKFDGILSTNLLYPMTRAIYGLRIREPYAAEFAFSGHLANDFMSQHSWREETARIGCETYFTATAITGGYRVCQSFLGVKDRTEARPADLVPAIRRTVGALFASLEPTFSSWSTRKGSHSIPTAGAEGEFTLDPLPINRTRLREMFAGGVAELESVFRSILSPATLAELQRIAPREDAYYSAELWAKTIYEFAAAFHKSVINRDHIIQALAPLFRGRALTFLVENEQSTAAGVENNIEGLCLEFERWKPYLLELWQDGE